MAECGLSVAQGLNAVDVSADQQVIAVGASNSLLLLRLWSECRGIELEETHFLKSHVIGQQSLSLKPVLKVKFNPTLSLTHLLATSSISGALAIWNIERCKEGEGHWVPDNVLKEHRQAVDSMCWHYSNPQTILSGSNDTCVKLWDLRVRSRSTLSISPKSSYVRDVQFRKVEGSHRFAAAFANGSVQVWDVRHPKKAEVILGAHDVAYTIDWNPEINNLLATGGRDGLVKIWDIFEKQQPVVTEEPVAEDDKSATPTRRNKRKHHHPIQTIETPEKGVSHIRWRPGHPYQIASTSLRGPSMNIWNTMSPRVPLVCINPCALNDSVTDYVWLDQHFIVDDVLGSSLFGTSWWDSSFEEDDAIVADDNSVLPGQVHLNIPSVSSMASLNSMNTSATPPTDTMSDRDTISILTGYENVMDNETLKEQQRRRFRVFKHRHRSDEDDQNSWGCVLSISKSGQISLRLVQNGTMPLAKFGATSMSLSSSAASFAVVHERIPAGRMGNALLLTSKSAKKPPKPMNIVRIFGPPEGDERGSKFASAFLGFDAERFISLAKTYTITSSASTNIDNQGKRRQSDSDELARCCSQNSKAASDAGAPMISQIWSLVKALYVPATVEEEVVGCTPLVFGSFSQQLQQQHILHEKMESQKYTSGRLSRIGKGSSRASSVISQHQRQDHREFGPSPLTLTRLSTSSPHTTPPRSPSSAASSKSLPVKLAVKQQQQQSENAGGLKEGELEIAPAESVVVGDDSENGGSNNIGTLAAKKVDKDKDDDEVNDRAKVMDLIGFVNTGLKKKNNSLWLDSSLDLLCRLSRVQPLDEERDFKSKGTILDQDKRELLEALAQAKPEPPIEPVPSGQRKLRKQQRMLRRRQFCMHYEAVYHRQLEMFSSLNVLQDDYVDIGEEEEGEVTDDDAGVIDVSDDADNDKSIRAEANDKLRSGLMHDILDYHAEIGDVQTCVMLVLVLGDFLSPRVKREKVRMWICAYVDLLQQLQVFSTAARIISACKDEEVERCYKMTSMIAVGCSSCSDNNTKNIIRAKPEFNGSCTTCKRKVSRCCICEQVVRGVYVWCQGCCHGGHLKCLNEWFVSGREKECPSGCGHMCSLSTG